MNKDNAAAFIPIIQALADGKTIQLYHESRKTWEEADNLEFSYPVECYRIKPEPREWIMFITPKGELTTNSDMMMRPSVRVREILDEP